MWIIAGVLLGVVLLAGLAGVHTGPHAHGVAVAGGIAVAAWFLFMAAEGHSTTTLWSLFGADLVVSATLGVMVWKALRHVPDTDRPYNSLEAEEGFAVSDLVPNGIVQVRGEHWSAASVNGTVRSGTRVQVIRDGGVRLEVWGEDAEATPSLRPFPSGSGARSAVGTGTGTEEASP
jgi:membrane-bound ClpP family serine protease